jgi:hypothetical protein
VYCNPSRQRKPLPQIKNILHTHHIVGKKTHILIISSKPMINPRRHNHQIALLQPQPYPSIILAPHIKIPATAQNIPNLLILMKMLVEEGFHLFFVAGQQVGGDFDLVAVLVVALGGDFVDGVQVVGEVVVGDAEGGEVGWVDGAAGVVGEALVALRESVSGVGR